MNLKNLKAQFLSKNYEEAEEHFLQMDSSNLDKFLIDLLDSNKSSIRSRSCSLIREKKIQNAVPGLFKNIFKEENKNNIGSLVFALTELDCSKYFIEIFKIYIFTSFEASNHANTILREQDFDYTHEDLKEVEEAWGKCQITPSLCPCYDESKEHIEKDIEYFRQELNKTIKRTHHNLIHSLKKEKHGK